jgi:hypothetical protein
MGITPGATPGYTPVPCLAVQVMRVPARYVHLTEEDTVIHHPIGIAGLIVNMIAVLLLLRFPPSVSQYTADGRPIIGWAGVATDGGKRRHLIRKHGYEFAIALLFLGFFLQLLDLITT